MTVLTGGEAVYETLVAAGVSHVFGIASIHNLPIYDAILRGGKITPISVRHEQGALHAADGYSRATGRLGAAITSTGPGACNAMTGLYEAGFSSSRVLMITGQVETGLYRKGKGAIHEAENQLIMLRSVTRVTESPRRTAEISEALARVIRDINTGRPQPGAIEIPIDLLHGKADFDIPKCVMGEPIEPDESAIEAAATAIGEAGKRIIIAGGGVIRSGASEELTRLAEALSVPVFTTTSGRGAIAEGHPLCMGAFLMPSSAAIANAELTIAIGTRFQELNTDKFTFNPPGKLVHIDADNQMIDLNYPADIAVVGDAKLSLTAISNRLNPEHGDEDFLDELTAAVTKIRHQARNDLGQDYPLIMDSIRELLPRPGNIIGDTTLPAAVWGNRLLPVFEPGTFMHSTSAAIGPGLPLAIGASLGSGEKSVVIQGDGGLMLNIGELSTAAQYNVPVIVCIFNNAGYGALRFLQDRHFEGRYTGVDLATPDFIKVAEGMGVKAMAVNSAKQFHTAFEEAMEHSGPVVLDIDQSSLSEMNLPF